MIPLLRRLRRVPGGIWWRWHARRITRALEERWGDEVQGGPFLGMRYDPSSRAGRARHLKLLGIYERELHPWMETVIHRRYDRIIDIGSAEGYYAVGLARSIPFAEVIAVDVDPAARAACRRLGDRNGIMERLTTEPSCDAETLGRWIEGRRCLVFCDCEGCEFELLPPVADGVPSATDWIIEVHRDEKFPEPLAEVLRRLGPGYTTATKRPDKGMFPDPPGFVSPFSWRVAIRERRSLTAGWIFATSSNGSASPL